MNLLTKDKLMNEDYISWAAFHASLELNPPNPPAIIALLPLFYCFTFISSQYLDLQPSIPAKHSRSRRIWLDMAPTNLETSVDTASWGSSSQSRAAQVWLHSIAIVLKEMQVQRCWAFLHSSLFLWWNM